MQQEFIPPLLKAENVVLSTSWQTLVTLEDVRQYTGIGLFVNLVKNDSTGINIKIFSKISQSDADEYQLPVIQINASTSTVKFTPASYILDDANQKITFRIATDNLFPFISVAMKVTTLGSTPAVLNKLYLSKSWSATG